MTDLLGSAADWLAGRRKASMSRTVTYRTDGGEVEVEAMVGESRFEAVDTEGMPLDSQARDYLIEVADLRVGGAPVRPERGHEIVEEIDGTPHRFEVSQYGGEPAWRYSSINRRTYRIHTTYIGTEQP